MAIKKHSHDVTLSMEAGTNASNKRILQHKVRVSSSVRKKIAQTREVPEEWRQFADGYEVSNRGNVRSSRQVLKNMLDSRREPIQVIHGKWYRVKRLVAEQFIPNPEGRRRVRHINGDTLDCRVGNLEWW